MEKIMLIVHTFFNCLNCGIQLEATDEEFCDGSTECPKCGHKNDLADEEIKFWEEEF
jgi:DNA-directed RNA polymerase subunit RPC12/RpoP